MNEISLLFYFIPGVQIVGTVQRKAEEKKRWGLGEKDNLNVVAFIVLKIVLSSCILK